MAIFNSYVSLPEGISDIYEARICPKTQLTFGNSM